MTPAGQTQIPVVASRSAALPSSMAHVIASMAASSDLSTAETPAPDRSDGYAEFPQLTGVDRIVLPLRPPKLYHEKLPGANVDYYLSAQNSGTESASSPQFPSNDDENETGDRRVKNAESKIELDHLFIFTSKGAPEAKMLTEAGFLEGPRRVHDGQGTSNVCFFFKKSYLEFLWVHDANETRSQSRIRLFERSIWKQTGHCPFGFGFRTIPENSVLAGINTWDYAPSFMPEGTSLRIVDNGEYYNREPEFFFLPFSRKVADEWYVHKNQVGNITDIIIVSPYAEVLSPQARLFQDIGMFSFQKGDRYLLQLTFDGGRQGKTVDWQPEFPLRIYF